MARHERVLDVYWQGPIDPEKFKAKAGHVLYAIYGQHHVYGRHALLYIGFIRQLRTGVHPTRT